MKRSIGYKDESEIDERIKYIEMQLMTETMALKQEKEYLKEISELKKNRPKVGKIAVAEASYENRDTGASLKEDIGAINEQLTQYFEAKRGVSAELKELNEGRSEQMGDLPALIKEKENLVAQVREKQTERNNLRDAFKEKEREYNQWRADQRKARQNRIQEEWQAKEAERKLERLKKKADQLDEQPHIQEITLIEQTILFCKSLVADKGPEKKEDEKAVDHGDLPAGAEVLLKKEDRDEFYYAPTAHKKKGKAKKSSSSKLIKHNAETFKLFSQIKLNAPISLDDIPDTLEQLEAQLASYQEKVEIWAKNRDDMKARILAGNVDEEEEAKEEAKEEEPKEEEANEEAKEEKEDE